MRKNLILVFGLVTIVVCLIFERMVTNEYIAFLERDIEIEQLYRSLQKGMTLGDLRNLSSMESDSVTKSEDESGAIVMRWTIREHIGPIHQFLGIQPRDTKSYMELFVDFDSQGRIVRIYYGG